MLFISRHVGGFMERRFGVVDTDDDTEEIVTYKEIEDIVNLGIDIQGVIAVLIDSKEGYRVTDISIYPNRLSNTLASVKAYTIYGIEINGWKGYISRIYWDAKRVTAPVVLKLSDFGDTLCDYLFSSVMILSFNELLYDVTLVLDDSLEVFPNAFFVNGRKYTIKFDKGHMVIDLRQVTKDSIARFVYEGMAKVIARNGSNSFCIIRDNEERYNRMFRECQVCTT